MAAGDLSSFQIQNCDTVISAISTSFLSVINYYNYRISDLGFLVNLYLDPG